MWAVRTVSASRRPDGRMRDPLSLWHRNATSQRRQWRCSPSRSSTKSVPRPTSSRSSRTTCRCARRARATRGCVRFTARRSPSFSVNRDRGFFHCFGCGVGGDVFKFIELQEKVGFTDAVRQLAQRFGIPIPELGVERRGARERAPNAKRCCAMHEVAAAYFREQLESPAGARIREYLPASAA